MKELKFTCPACGQHIECDPSHAGENVPCPGCAALIRVPQDGSIIDVELPTSALSSDPEKVSYVAAPSEDEIASRASPPPSPPARMPVASAVTKPKSPAATTASHKWEMHFNCPVCQAALKISVEAESPSHVAGHEKHVTAEEREQQIATVLQSPHISAYPPTKPRLDKILGDESKEAA